MFMTIFKPLFLLSMISTSLSVDSPSSYDDVFQELSKKPISQLDFRIQLLEQRIKNFNKKVGYRFNFDDEPDSYYGYDHVISLCDKVHCKKDFSNSKLIVCEVFTDNSGISSRVDADINLRVEKVKFIYHTILNLAKEIIHESFDKSNLRVIIKMERMQIITPKHFENNEYLKEIFISHTPEEKTLVIFENGVPQYQEAFFLPDF